MAEAKMSGESLGKHDPNAVCQLQNIGPHRVADALDRPEYRCLHLFAVDAPPDIEGIEQADDTAICNVVVSFQATDGYKQGDVSRITDKGPRQKCPMFPDLVTGLEYNSSDKRRPPAADGRTISFLEEVVEITDTRAILPDDNEQ